jgi:hypothetical protein
VKLNNHRWYSLLTQKGDTCWLLCIISTSSYVGSDTTGNFSTSNCVRSDTTGKFSIFSCVGPADITGRCSTFSYSRTSIYVLLSLRTFDVHTVLFKKKTYYSIYVLKFDLRTYVLRFTYSNLIYALRVC